MRVVKSHPGPLLDSWVEVFAINVQLGLPEERIFVGHFIDFASELDWYAEKYGLDMSFEEVS